MSTSMTLYGGKLPARLQNREVDAVTKALAGGFAGGGRRISIKGSVFRMIVGGKQVAENEARAMNVVVVAAAPAVNRQYYESTYNEEVVASPTCQSSDGKTPDKGVENAQSDACASCPQNISGSGQGDSRACRYQQRLAVVLESEIGGPVYQLALPATSLFGKGEANNTKLPLQAYARYLAQNGVPITEVVTEMRFDTKSATPKLTFKAVRALEDDEAELSAAQGASLDAQQAITLSVFKQDGAKTTAKPAAKALPKVEEEEGAPKPPKKAKPVVEEEGDEPVVASKSKPAEAPAGRKPVSAVLAEWDD